jgi:2'-5' RNA ligase
MTPQNRYFIAIILPNDVSRQVTEFRNHFKNSHNSSAALKNMPHITLKAPFKTETHLHEQVVHWFKNLDVTIAPFVVDLHNFGIFNNPKNPVVYVHPELTAALANLQKAVVNGFEKAFPNIPLHFHEHTFKPHITIAYRDLAYAEFIKAWQEYSTKQYSAQFTVTGFYLLQHNDSEWRVAAEHILK